MAALRSETDGRHGVSSRAAESNGVRATQEQQPARSRHPHWGARVPERSEKIPRGRKRRTRRHLELGPLFFPAGFGKTLRPCLREAWRLISMVMIRALSCLLVLGAAHALQLGGTPTGPRSQGAAAVSELSEVPVSLDILSEIQRTVAGQPAVVFSKSSCEESLECKRLFDAIAQPYVACEIDQRSDGEEVEAALLSLTQGRALPNVFVRGQLLGGSAEMQEAAATGLLEELLADSVLPPKGCVVPTRREGPK